MSTTPEVLRSSETSIERPRPGATEEFVREPDRPGRGAHKRHNASNRIRNVIVRAGSVIHRILAASRNPPFERNELIDHPRILKQIETPRIQHGKEGEIQLGTVHFGRIVGHTLLAEGFPWP